MYKQQSILKRINKILMKTFHSTVSIFKGPMFYIISWALSLLLALYFYLYLKTILIRYFVEYFVKSFSLNSHPFFFFQACAPRYVYFSINYQRREPVGNCWIARNSMASFQEYSPCRIPCE